MAGPRLCFEKPETQNTADSDYQGAAEKLGFVDLRLEASLQLGRSEADAARLEAVAKEASERGFELIARKASAARGS